MCRYKRMPYEIYPVLALELSPAVQLLEMYLLVLVSVFTWVG